MLAAGLWLLCLGCSDERGRHAATKTEPLPQRQASPPPTGFRLDSIPSGAPVLVDGVLRAITPVTVDDLSPGHHVVRLELAGYKPWETQMAIAAGMLLDLPAARLWVDADAVALGTEQKPLPPLPEWPKDRGFPGDLLIVMTSASLLQYTHTTIRARGPGSADVTLRDSSWPAQSCTFPIDGLALARFGWPQFVEVIEAGQQRQGESYSYCGNVEDCRPSFGVSIRAFGRTLAEDAVARHRLGPEIEARAHAVIPNFNPWPPRGLDEAIERFDAAISSCLATATRRAPHRGRSRFELAIARHGGRARLISIDARAHSQHELACIRSAIAKTTFPGSAVCERRLEFDLRSMRRPILNPYRGSHDG